MHLITDEYFVDSVLADAEFTRALIAESKLAVLSKYQGALADSLLHARNNGAWKPVWTDAVRVAAMAMRIATEGDASLAVPNHVNTRGME